MHTTSSTGQEGRTHAFASSQLPHSCRESKSRRCKFSRSNHGQSYAGACVLSPHSTTHSCTSQRRVEAVWKQYGTNLDSALASPGAPRTAYCNFLFVGPRAGHGADADARTCCAVSASHRHVSVLRQSVHRTEPWLPTEKQVDRSRGLGSASVPSVWSLSASAQATSEPRSGDCNFGTEQALAFSRCTCLRLDLSLLPLHISPRLPSLCPASANEREANIAECNAKSATSSG